ncbi:MAG: SsgA family sporulation/cell division regulator, partial [Frankia sp.]|nr:SsgA family sporulation/cell division regulator [Frankia sp.]
MARDESVRVPAQLHYAVSDPYAVRVTFLSGADRVVEWTFARQLLTDG